MSCDTGMEKQTKQGLCCRGKNIFIVTPKQLYSAKSWRAASEEKFIKFRGVVWKKANSSLLLFALSVREVVVLAGGWLRDKCPHSDSSVQTRIRQSPDGNYRGLTHKTFSASAPIALRKYLEWSATQQNRDVNLDVWWSLAHSTCDVRLLCKQPTVKKRREAAESWSVKQQRDVLPSQAHVWSFLRPNTLNFTTALTWCEPENGPIRPENLSASSRCHFSPSRTQRSAAARGEQQILAKCTGLFCLLRHGQETS